MKKQITRVSLVQFGRVLSLMYVMVSLPMALLFIYFGYEPAQSIVSLLAVPVGYGLLIFVVAMLGGCLYNLAAGLVGGIEYTTSEVDSDA